MHSEWRERRKKQNQQKIKEKNKPKEIFTVCFERTDSSPHNENGMNASPMSRPNNDEYCGTWTSGQSANRLGLLSRTTSLTVYFDNDNQLVADKNHWCRGAMPGRNLGRNSDSMNAINTLADCYQQSLGKTSNQAGSFVDDCCCVENENVLRESATNKRYYHTMP